MEYEKAAAKQSGNTLERLPYSTEKHLAILEKLKRIKNNVFENTETLTLNPSGLKRR